MPVTFAATFDLLFYAPAKSVTVIKPIEGIPANAATDAAPKNSLGFQWWAGKTARVPNITGTDIPKCVW
jgi:hypothetical protein